MFSMPCRGLLAFEAHQLDQADLRNGEALAAAGDHQRGNDGQGEGNLDLQQRALARGALEIDHAADLLDVGLHHVHADAAAGDVGDLLGGGEARQEDQVQRARAPTCARPARR